MISGFTAFIFLKSFYEPRVDSLSIYQKLSQVQDFILNSYSNPRRPTLVEREGERREREKVREREGERDRD